MSKRTHSVLIIGLVSAFVIAAHYLPGLTDNVIEREIRNALHILGFAVVAALVFEVIPGNSLKTAASTLLIVVTLGVVAEFAQRLGGKIADYNDVYRDVLGVVVFLVARLIWPGKNGGALRKVLAAGIGLLVFVPLAHTLVTRHQLATQIPLIADFEGGKEFLYVLPVNADLEVTPVDNEPGFSGRVAKLHLARQNWSGVQIEPVVGDWSSYQYIAMTAQIVNGAERSQVDVHLNDGPHETVRSQHLIGGHAVGGTPVHFRLPLRDARTVDGRPPLDTGNIQRIYIIGKARTEGGILLLDNIRLEN